MGQPAEGPEPVIEGDHRDVPALGEGLSVVRRVAPAADGEAAAALGFGSAIGACMIFVLGVVVGKRVEARSAAHQAAPAADPLAALDELGSTEEGLTFHSTLAEKRPQNRREAPPARDEVRPEVPPIRKPRARMSPAAQARSPVRWKPNIE